MNLAFSPPTCYAFLMEKYDLYRSRRRTLALEITRDCRVVVRAPLKTSQARIDAFVADHAAWIAEKLALQRQRALTRPPEPTDAEIAALKRQAWDILPGKVAHWSEVMDLHPTGLKVTTARTRYGSCSGRDSLCFSCFLMAKPEAAIDLVVVHELCHIAVKNHGPDFYALLSRYLPDHKERMKLLQQ